MATLRKLIVFAVFVAFALAAAVFAYGNRDPVAIDVGFIRLESVSMTLAFSVTFALGSIFGVLCAGLALLGMIRERRRLRRELRSAEAEISNLRSMPLQNAN